MSVQEFNRISYQSESSDSDSDKENEKRKVLKKHTWLYQQTFPGKEEADGSKSKRFGPKTSLDARETNAGRKQFYRCNLVPYRGQQCAVAIQLLFDAESFEVLQFKTEEEHNHDELMVDRKTIGINKLR